MKRTILYSAVVAVVGLVLAASPAFAQTVRDKTCTETAGTNTMTYDCGFNVKDYVVGTPVTVTLGFTCTGLCGPVMSFGLGEKPFTPPGAAGRLVGGKRSPDGLMLTFVFEKVKPGSGVVANAHFSMNVMMDDGMGGSQAMSCPVDVHVVQ